MSGNKPAVLMVSKNHELAESVQTMLDDCVTELTVSSDVSSAVDVLAARAIDLIVLAPEPSDPSPSPLLAGIRQVTQQPVLVLASGDSETVADALEHGADDCVHWPVSKRELRARMALRCDAHHDQPTIFKAGDLIVDARQRTALQHDEEVVLTDREFDLLAYLISHKGETLTCDQLLAEVWGSRREWQSVSTVSEHIYRLRRKLEDDPRRPSLILTVRGCGYRFAR